MPPGSNVSHSLTVQWQKVMQGKNESHLLPMPVRYQIPLLVLAMAGAVPCFAFAGNAVQEMVEAGQIMPLETIRRNVIASTPGEYVGVEFDTGSKRYRFRFMQNGALVNVDVDARTGRRLAARQSF